MAEIAPDISIHPLQDELDALPPEVRAVVWKLARGLSGQATDLLKWALQTSRGLGVYHAGFGIGADLGDVWCCHGCNAEFCRDHGHPDDYDPRHFAHAANCKYVAARNISGMD